MKKKIIMFSSTWHQDYITSLLSGISRYIQQNDIEIHVFNIYNSIDKTDLVQKEQDILFLPDFSSYDGMLVVFNSVGEYPLVEQVTREFASTGKKVLCIDYAYGGQPNIGIDNYASFYQIVEHLITEHGCRTFNYLGGPADNAENILRFSAFCDCLKAHSLSYDPERVINLNFLTSDGKRAYQVWKEKGLHLPDAVVCANDQSALGYCMQADTDGYIAPRDFRITGFDNIDEAQHFSPSLTSINRSWETMGYESISQLIKLMEGEPPKENYYIKGSLRINESCGCQEPSRDIKSDLLAKYREMKDLDFLDLRLRKVQQLFCSANTDSAMQEAMTHAIEDLDLPSLTICLNEMNSIRNGSIFGENYTDTVVAITPDSKELIDRKKLLPDKVLQEEHPLLFFSPLHFGQHNFGYCMIPYRPDMMRHNKHRKFIDNLAFALECTSQQKLLSVMNERLKNLYVQDQLTGLYNRFGYMDIASHFYVEQRGRVCLYYIDVDNLKSINDTFGHAMGDRAIRGVVDAINNTFVTNAIKVRMGGDEFLVVDSFYTEEEIKSRETQFMEFLTDYSQRTSLPFALSASIGHIKNDSLLPTLEQLVHSADAEMYRVKQQKKQKAR